jgi:hypothetical protein
MTSALNIEYTYSTNRNDLSKEWDIIYIPSGYFRPDTMPNAKLILYGPQNFTFPEGEWLHMNHKDDPRIYYNTLSKWNTAVYEEVSNFQNNMKMIALPFSVDINRFQPCENKIYERDCFIYFKARNPNELENVKNLCNQIGLNYSVLIYGNYREEDYIHILNTSKFGIWIGCHESQGFAAQEALSMNVPLIVWNAKTMRYYYNKSAYGKHMYVIDDNKYKLNCTSVTTWDDTCGIIVDETSVESGIKHMVEHYRDYAPRDLVTRELSPATCMQRWVNLLK